MVDELLTGISLKLNQVFGDSYEIYGDKEVVQGLRAPCFFIAVLSPSQIKNLGQSYFRQYPFDIQYFPKKAEDNLELHRIAAALFEALEYINLLNGDLLRGTSLHYEIINKVLHFFASYNLSLRKESWNELMEHLTVYSKTT